MEILGIGPTEFLFIIIILLLVLGPADLVELGKKMGRFIRKMRNSETWAIVSNLAATMRNLPNTLAEETGSEEILREVMPERFRQPVQNIPLEGTTEKTPPFPLDNKLNPPEAETFSSWVTPTPPEPPVVSPPEIEQKETDETIKDTD